VLLPNLGLYRSSGTVPSFGLRYSIQNLRNILTLQVYGF